MWKINYNTKDIFNDAHTHKRGILVDIDDPEVGSHKFARTPPHLSATPEIRTDHAPNLGQHTRELMEDLLGYTNDEVDTLAASGVVQIA